MKGGNMAINTGKLITAAGVGVVDEVLEYWDAHSTPARTESFRTATDIGRLLMVGVGLGAQIFMPRYAALGETLATAATPLLVKSIAKPVKKSLKIEEALAVPRRVAPPLRESTVVYPTPGEEVQVTVT
jgi:hypothetical protein